MPHYQIRFLDGRNRAVLARDFEGKDDLAALAAAEKLCDMHSIEVWQGERRVARVKQGNAALDAGDPQSL
ncbi:MAG TPA: hypothetical protein VHC40_02665 [Rhizomicrobium sp.]|nr:hypothetical protein [Rhizomicrobium sp.]